MTKNSKQLWQLELHGRKLKYGRLDKSGQVRWAKKDWEIRKDSWLPMGVFYTPKSFIVRCFNKVREKSFDTQKAAVRKGLCEAAEACGCTWESNRAQGDVVWFLNGKRFYAFQIEDFHKHADAKPAVLQELLRKRRPRFEKMERESKALLRGSLAVLKGGFVKIVPGRTRSD